MGGVFIYFDIRNNYNYLKYPKKGMRDMKKTLKVTVACVVLLASVIGLPQYNAANNSFDSAVTVAAGPKESRTCSHNYRHYGQIGPSWVHWETRGKRGTVIASGDVLYMYSVCVNCGKKEIMYIYDYRGDRPFS